MAENVQPGDWVEGPFWEAVVQVVGLETRDGYDVVTVAGPNQGPTRTCVLTPADWEQITRATRADRRHIRFSGDSFRFRLGIQAHRLRLAHSIDPYAALNASRIDPLSHQFEAVYGHLLAQPVVRALLAHDAGAGKTVTLLVVVDGFRPDGLAAARCPNLTALRARGTATLHASSVMPSLTLPCHMSIFHSVPPTRHGITSNDWMPMARPLPGLADVAHAAGRRNAFLYNWEPLRNLSRPNSLDLAYFRRNNKHPEGDQVIAEEAARYLSGDCLDFAFVYLGVLDNVGHKHGFMSDEYLVYLERVDGAVGTLLDALPDDATVLLTSDHGGHERIHGTDEPEDMTVPWMIAGPHIRRGYEIETPVSLLDTAPTLARVLGIAPDPDWEGRCVEGIFA